MKYNSIFAVGTGRCGTHLLTALMDANKQIQSHHIRDSLADSFYRYAAWNKLPIDDAGFLAQRKLWVGTAHYTKQHYFEANPYLSFHVVPLYQQMDAKFIFLIRNPEAVVRSHIVKGWYKDLPQFSQTNLAVGFQYNMKPNHFFGRIIPTGATYENWVNLTRVGKLAWMWNIVNLQIAEQLKNIPAKNYAVLKIESLTHDKLQQIFSDWGIEKVIYKRQFERIVKKRPGKGRTTNTTIWSPIEKAEFLRETAEATALFSY